MAAPSRPLEVERNQFPVDRLTVLERNQHVVHQRHGQVGRHQCRAGRRQGQQEAGEELPFVGAGKAGEAEKCPG
jgi:hypothetical protein